MRRILFVAAVALVTSAITATATEASATRWVPGTAYTVSETDANGYLERAVDSAFCQGIPRFGHTGEFPYEEYRVFDCMLDRDDLHCLDWRFRAVKGSRYGMFKLVAMRQDADNCYLS